MKYPVDMSVKPDVSTHFDEVINTITYIAKDPSSDHCAIIDSVMSINYAADHLSAVPYIQETLGKVFNESKKFQRHGS